jgi:hypothetical protein
MRIVWLLTSMLLITGCAGTQAARGLSRETLAHVVEYEEQIRDMSRVLAANYRRTDDHYNEILPSFQQTSEIAVEANLANDAADQMLRAGVTDSAVREYVASVLRAQQEQRSRFTSLRAQQIAARDAALASTEQDEKALQATRARLEQLQREPSFQGRLAQLQPLITAGFRAVKQGEGGATP